jgi:hypothetical protein
MNIGIDIDQTLTKYPDFFVELGKLFRAAGHKVYLITGLGDEGLEKRREKWSYVLDQDFYDDIFTTACYNMEEVSLIGKEPDNEKIIGKFKQRMCKELEVDIMFDDKAAIHREFGEVPIFEVE